jgi:uncharacterized membrane protein HdeD (DUF308 family)
MLTWKQNERATVIVLVLGVQGLIMGAAEIAGGYAGGGIGSFYVGVVNIVLGLILLSSKMTAALAVPIVFGVLLLIQGVGALMLAFRIRSA